MSFSFVSGVLGDSLYTTRKSRLDIGTLKSVRIATDVKTIYDISYDKTDVF